MEAVDSQKTYCYSHDQILLSAFEMELRNHTPDRWGSDKELIESYLRDRIREILNRWRD